VAHNYLDRGYLELLRPLDFRQVAPFVYLWVPKTFVSVLGFSEYSLRLYVFLCSVASLLVFRRLAGRVLQGTARLLAVGTFAVAYPLLRYSAEAKPYGSDFFVSLVLLTLAVE
jgi:4-amino-4-deoxy-L-arabinose transferase-like glycosyltransferase